MNNDYVNKYATLENNHWWFITRKKIIMQVLHKFFSVENDNSLKILNVGAAAGASSKWLANFGKVYSLENDPYFVQTLRNQNMEVTEGSITAIPFNSNEFDLVCAFDVIEHVKDDVTAFAELQRVCKPAGKICITVPAFQSLWSIHDKVNEHQRRYKDSTLKKLIKTQSNNSIIYSTYFNSLLFIPIYIVRKLENLRRGNTDKVKSDFEFYQTPEIISKFLQKIFSLELLLLKLIRLPFGVSLLTLIEKIKPKSPD